VALPKTRLFLAIPRPKLIPASGPIHRPLSQSCPQNIPAVTPAINEMKYLPPWEYQQGSLIENEQIYGGFLPSWFAASCI
jgi:hypothetical protein